MSNFIPSATGAKSRGLGPKEQKLQAMREKLAKKNDTNNATTGASNTSAKSLAGVKKTSFNRKAV